MKKTFYMGCVQNNELLGCFLNPMQERFVEEFTKILKKAFQSENIPQLKELFSHIQWFEDLDPDAIQTGGSILLRYIESGSLEAYIKYTNETFSALTKNGYYDEDGKKRYANKSNWVREVIEENDKGEPKVKVKIQHTTMEQLKNDGVEIYVVDLDKGIIL